MFPFFLFFVESSWWEFRNDRFDQKAANSFNRPIFALLHYTDCPHCKGMPEQIKDFSTQNTNHSDLIVTKINCDNEINCRRFKMKGTPSFVLIMGKDRNYWPITEDKTIEGWSGFIDKWLNYKIQEVTDPEQLERVKENPNCGSNFHIQTPSTKDRLFQIIQKNIRNYIIYNCSFTYSINETLKNAQMFVYRAPGTEEMYTGSVNKYRIDAWIMKNRFGYLHKFYKHEWWEEINRRKVFAVIAYNDLNSDDEKLLRNVSRGRTNEFSFGWVNGEEEKTLLKHLKINSTQIPLALLADKKGGCSADTKMDSNEIQKSGWFRKVANGQICDKKYEKIMNKNLLSLRFSGLGLVVTVFAVFLSLIAILQTNNDDMYFEKFE